MCNNHAYPPLIARACLLGATTLPLSCTAGVKSDFINPPLTYKLRVMGTYSDTAKPVVPAMLQAVVVTAEPASPIVWDDPIQLTHGELAAALFQGLLCTSIQGIEPELLYPASRAISRNVDGMASATLTRTFTELLTLADVQALAPDILEAVRSQCPADTMFGNEIRMGGFKALTRYHVTEAIAAGVIFAKTQGGHGSKSRTGETMKEIASYGTAARDALPGLKELIVSLNDHARRGNFPRASSIHE